MGDPEILVARQGVVGVITLNRPGALNALNAGMVTAITAGLDAFEGDAAVARIVVTGAGRAFCAGADVRVWRDGAGAEPARDLARLLATAGWAAVASASSSAPTACPTPTG